MPKILILIAIGVIFFLALNRLFPNTPFNFNNEYNPVPKTTYRVSSPSPFPVTDKVPYHTDNYVKRQFDLGSKFIVGLGRDATPSANFPKEIISVPDGGLKDMKCTSEFYASAQGFDISDPITDRRYNIQSADETYNQMLSLIGSGIDLNKSAIYSFQYCLLDGGDKIVRVQYQKLFQDYQQEGENPNNFWLIQGNDIRKVSIHTGAIGYFGCKKPLQLTTNNILYYQCHGGDTTYYDSIYKIDFNKRDSTKLLECYQSEGDLMNQPNPPLVCK